MIADVRESVLMKADEVQQLRERTVLDGADAAGRGRRARCASASRAAGRLLALGNGGSATDAMDLVADFVAAGHPAIDLTADSAIVTAIANDIGSEAIFARQVIAYGRAGDVLVALSTSGNSLSVIEALAEARRRGARDDRVRRLRRRARRRRAAGRPRRGHPLPAHTRGSRRRRRPRTTCCGRWLSARPVLKA